MRQKSSVTAANVLQNKRALHSAYEEELRFNAFNFLCLFFFTFLKIFPTDVTFQSRSQLPQGQFD